MEDPGPEVAEGLLGLGLEVARWNRRALGQEAPRENGRASGGLFASAWPPPGPFGAAALRMPRSRDALAMSLHAAWGALETGGTLLLYGAKDEGIGSAGGVAEELFSSVGTVGVGGRCRLLQGIKRGTAPGARTTLEAWREAWAPDHPALPSRWVSYPGIFAHRQLDPGTRLLLDVLPEFSAGARILDYGCGSGILGAAVLRRQPGATVHLLDVDAVALEAARENVPGAELILADGLDPIPPDSYDAVITNPPFHRGKEEDPGLLAEVIRGARRVLCSGGALTLVTQRRIRLEKIMEDSFARVSVLARDPIFSVWEGRRPRKPFP